MIAMICDKSYLQVLAVFLIHTLGIISNFTDYLRKTSTGKTELPIFQRSNIGNDRNRSKLFVCDLQTYLVSHCLHCAKNNTLHIRIRNTGCSK